MQNLIERPLVEKLCMAVQDLPESDQYKTLGYAECLSAVYQAEEAKKLPGRKRAKKQESAQRTP